MDNKTLKSYARRDDMSDQSPRIRHSRQREDLSRQMVRLAESICPSRLNNALFPFSIFMIMRGTGLFPFLTVFFSLLLVQGIMLGEQTPNKSLSKEAVSLYQERDFEWNGEIYRYRLLMPAKLEPGQRYPLVFFLHGAGERGRDNEVQLQYLPEAMARSPYREKYPAFVVVPQCRDQQRWVEAEWSDRESTPMRPQPAPMMAMAMALLDKTLYELPVELSRVYLSGLSMGGYGAWELAARRPGTFAVVAPICGGGDENTARLLAESSVWAWHGVRDTVVWPDRSRRMVEAIQAVGGKVKYTELPGVEHNSFLKAYAPESGLLDWMFAQHLGPVRTDLTPEKGAPFLRIMCVGDSNTEAREFPGYRSYLKQELARLGITTDFVGSRQGGEPASDPEHEGYSGEGIGRIRQRVREGMIEQYPADFLLLLVGSNDLWVDVAKDRSPVSEERARLLAGQLVSLMDEMLQRRPSLRLIAGLPSTPGNTPAALAAFRDEMRLAIERGQTQKKSISWVDMKVATNDGVHYSLEGYQRMARLWTAEIQKILGPAHAAKPVGPALPPSSVEFKPPASSVEVFDYAEVEIVVGKPTVLNPFMDVQVKGEFSVKGKSLVVVEGFCDSPDGSRFRVRFMPSQPGVHRWRVSYSQEGFTRAQEGNFEARRAGRRGPVQVDQEHPWHFVYAGTGEHFFWNSTTTYALAAWRDERVIRESLDRLARLRINRIRVSLIPPRVKSGMQWKEPEVTSNGWFSFCLNVWPAQRPDDVDNPGLNPHRFNVAQWQKYERLIEYAREKGIQVSVIFYVDGALPGVDPFRAPAMGGDLERLYYRYAAARLSAFANVMWDVANEHHLFRTEAWVEAMGVLLKSVDPYHHLMSVHGHGEFPFRKSAWADFAMYQSWDEHGAYDFMLKSRQKQAATGRPMPQVNEEYGYEDHYPYPWGEARLWPARIADNRRRLAWEMTMAAGYQTTGERANQPGYGGWINGYGSDEMILLNYHARLYDFWTQLPWWTMEPQFDAAPSPVRCLASTGGTYVFYWGGGKGISVKLAKGDYRARWFDPRTGVFQSVGTVSGPKWETPAPPDDQDWVLLLESQ